MPTYDYHCRANGRTIEVRHPMHQRLTTWAELCACAGIDPSGAPAEAEVEKLLNTGGVVHAESLGSGTEPACAPGAMCGGGGCRFAD